MTFFYGLQHRRLSVKNRDGRWNNRRGIDGLQAQAEGWCTCSKSAEPGQFVTQVSWSRTSNLRSSQVRPSLATERTRWRKDL